MSDFLADAALARARDAVGAALARGEREGGPRPRLLFVVHEGSGGAVATNADLMSALRGEYECYCFSSDRRVLRLRRIEGDASELLEEWDLERPILLGDFSRPDYRRAFASALARCAPELVHVRHVYKHTHDAPRMAAAQCIPMVMSFHDFYCVCPTIQLLDEHGRYCGGRCTPGHGECRTVNAGRLPILKHAFVYQWRDEVEASLAGVDAFVTTSATTRDVHLRHLEVTLKRPFEIIEHGRDLVQRRGLAVAPEPGGPVRVLVPGHLDRHKGADLLDAMLELDSGGRLALHFLGEVPERYRHLGVCHGGYARAHLADRMREIGPAFIAVLSVWPESYSHVVTEAWAAGIPVLATDLGAQAARVRERGGGFLIPHDDPAAALAAVLRAADDREAYAEQTELAHVAGLPSVADMASRYADCYRDVLDRRRTFAAPAEARVTPLRRGVWRMTALVSPQTGRDAYALRRYLHPDVRWKLRTRVECRPGGLSDDDADLVLVQQGAVASDELEELLDDVSARDLPLVVECAGPPDEGDERLMAAARLLIVPSTGAALDLHRLGRPVAVLPPLLDERLFLPGTGGRPPAGTSREAGRAVRIALLGTSGGARESEFLRGVVERLSAAGPLRYELEVVGDDAPDPCRDYPAYVNLLRRRRPGWDIAVAPGSALGPARPLELRCLEHAGLGLPAVYSASEAHGGVQAELTGLTAPDDEDAWCDALERLAVDDALRDRLRFAAWEEVTERRLLRHGARRLLDILGQTFGDYAAPSVQTMTGSQHGR